MFPNDPLKQGILLAGAVLLFWGAVAGFPNESPWDLLTELSSVFSEASPEDAAFEDTELYLYEE